MDLNEDGEPDLYFYQGTLSVNPLSGVSYINVSPTINGYRNPFQLRYGDHGEIVLLNNAPRVWKDYKDFYPIPQADLLMSPKLG